MGRRGRARQQPDENCGLANETIVSQTKSRVTPNLSVSSLSVKSACFSQAQFSTRSPESATKNSLRTSLESQHVCDPGIHGDAFPFNLANEMNEDMPRLIVLINCKRPCEAVPVVAQYDVFPDIAWSK